jgi:biopolymer transport protein ExbB
MEAGNKDQGMSNSVVKRANPMKSIFPILVLVLAFGMSFAVFYTIFSSPDNFEEGPERAVVYKEWKKAHSEWVKAGSKPEAEPEEPEHPTKGHPVNFFGIVYKGGVVIPVALGIMVTLIIIAIERIVALYFLAAGRGSNDVFAHKVRAALGQGDVDGAIAECDRQRGSVASVCKSGLLKYREVENNPKLDAEQKKAAIQQELEEATSLELPGLERNLVFISTFVSIGVLVGLLGTVLGMIKAFQALATSGTPDAASLSTGISEALVNTAIGIGTSTISIILYNVFTTRIDRITYGIDETGFTIVQTFERTH